MWKIFNTLFIEMKKLSNYVALLVFVSVNILAPVQQSLAQGVDSLGDVVVSNGLESNSQSENLPQQQGDSYTNQNSMEIELWEETSADVDNDENVTLQEWDEINDITKKEDVDESSTDGDDQSSLIGLIDETIDDFEGNEPSTDSSSQDESDLEEEVSDDYQDKEVLPEESISNEPEESQWVENVDEGDLVEVLSDDEPQEEIGEWRDLPTVVWSIEYDTNKWVIKLTDGEKEIWIKDRNQWASNPRISASYWFYEWIEDYMYYKNPNRSDDEELVKEYLWIVWKRFWMYFDTIYHARNYMQEYFEGTEQNPHNLLDDAEYMWALWDFYFWWNNVWVSFSELTWEVRTWSNEIEMSSITNALDLRKKWFKPIINYAEAWWNIDRYGYYLTQDGWWLWKDLMENSSNSTPCDNSKWEYLPSVDDWLNLYRMWHSIRGMSDYLDEHEGEDGWWGRRYWSIDSAIYSLLYDDLMFTDWYIAWWEGFMLELSESDFSVNKLAEFKNGSLWFEWWEYHRFEENFPNIVDYLQSYLNYARPVRCFVMVNPKTVTFDMNWWNETSFSRKVEQWDTIDAPYTDPTRDWYTFQWRYTADGEEWDFESMSIDGDMTLYAEWRACSDGFRVEENVCIPDDMWWIIKVSDGKDTMYIRDRNAWATRKASEPRIVEAWNDIMDEFYNIENLDLEQWERDKYMCEYANDKLSWRWKDIFDCEEIGPNYEYNVEWLWWYLDNPLYYEYEMWNEEYGETHSEYPSCAETVSKIEEITGRKFDYYDSNNSEDPDCSNESLALSYLEMAYDFYDPRYGEIDVDSLWKYYFWWNNHGVYYDELEFDWEDYNIISNMEELYNDWFNWWKIWRDQWEGWIRWNTDNPCNWVWEYLPTWDDWQNLMKIYARKFWLYYSNGGSEGWDIYWEGNFYKILEHMKLPKAGSIYFENEEYYDPTYPREYNAEYYWWAEAEMWNSLRSAQNKNGYFGNLRFEEMDGAYFEWRNVYEGYWNYDDLQRYANQVRCFVNIPEVLVVTFISDGQMVKEMNVVSWKTLSTQPSISKPGSTLKWWHTSDGKQFDFNTAITKDITLYADRQWYSWWGWAWWGGNWWGWWGWWWSWGGSWKTPSTSEVSEAQNNLITTNEERGKPITSVISSGSHVINIDLRKYDSDYSVEFNEAYQFSYKHWITTVDTIKWAELDGKLTRIAMAKMLSYYAINVLWHKPNAAVWVENFVDVSERMNSEYDNAVTLAYQLWIMWINMPNHKFRPNDYVTRAEFVTALSRMLYGTSDGKFKQTAQYYVPHMVVLENKWIITNVDPNMMELRWYVMIMLMRAAWE